LPLAGWIAAYAWLTYERKITAPAAIIQMITRLLAALDAL